MKKELSGLEYGEFHSGHCSVCGKLSSPVYHNYNHRNAKKKIVCLECAPLLSLQQESVLSSYIDLSSDEEKDLRSYQERLKMENPSLFSYRENFRLARMTDSRQVGVYNYAKKEGFNGFHDEKIKLGNDFFMIGWNYD